MVERHERKRSVHAAGRQSSVRRRSLETSRGRSQASERKRRAPQGNLQALQTLAQIGLLNVEQLQKVRQLILTDTSLQANAIQTRSDRETFEQAAWRNFIKTPAIQTSGGARF